MQFLWNFFFVSFLELVAVLDLVPVLVPVLGPGLVMFLVPALVLVPVLMLLDL